MTEFLKILSNKNVIEALLVGLEKVIGMVAGDNFPVSSIASLVRLAVDKVDSEEYTNEQIQKIQDRLSVITNKMSQIKLEIEKNIMNIQYFKEEQNLRNQFSKFMEIFNVNPPHREASKNLFMDDFKRSGEDINLHKLYNAVTGDNLSRTSVLEIILDCEQKSLRQVENFCTKLKHLFCIGLIAFLGYLSLKGKDEEKLLQEQEEWCKKMEVVQSKINEAIKQCINSFPTQAKTDTEGIVLECSDKNNQELADTLIGHLKTKYNWVSWMVRVFNSPTGLFTPKKDYQGLMGNSWFQVLASGDKNVVISYSTSPKSFDKTFISTLVVVLEHNRCIWKMPSMTLMSKKLFLTNPFGVVHTVKSSCKNLGYSCNFSDELHYYEDFKDFYVFFHSA
ncbi:uncharacterized protein [Paramisgurnus dabryanus]|uniref:uncharacterized protein n=1 Tax=Paramisgurnus dabryanus TaxID=90735 RepID=UPI0031F37615